ncbi:pilus assembly protein PilM, partial [Candidatus Parcubacteria bacterium]|nr:pilus assembly protein PilM [Candidatus Parcubacteria bacterium]
MRKIKKSLGLDISSRSIEALELRKDNGRIKLSALSRVVLGKGIIEQGRIKDFPTLARAVGKALTNATPQAIKTDRIVFAYPETQTYTQMISLNTSEKDLNAAIKEKMLATLPIKESDLLYNYRLLKPNDSSEEKKILLLATSRVATIEWQQFFSRLNLHVVGFTNASVAAYFGLFERYTKSSKCIIDLGSRNIVTSFFNFSGLVYAFNYYLGGDYLSKEIARANNINIQEAERLKINIGEKTKQETRAILNKYFKVFGAELKINLEKYQKNVCDLPDEIILFGGGSKIKGVENFIAAAGIEIPIRVGESSLFEHKGQEFISAAGLARLGFNPRFNKDKFLALNKDLILSAKTIQSNFSSALRRFKIIGLALILCSIIVASAYLLLNFRPVGMPAGNKYSFSYTLPLSVPITVVREKGANAASGRIVKATINQAGDLEATISQARTEAFALLKGEE